MSPITPRYCRDLCDIGMPLADSPLGSTFTKWFCGVLLPVGVWGYGFWCCLSPDATSISLHGITLASRATAVAYGIVCISIASFAHFHYFWGNVERLCGLSDLGKTLAAVGLGTSLIYLLYRIAMFQ